MPSDAVSQLRNETQQAMEAHLAVLDAQEERVGTDPEKRQRRRSEIMTRLEKAYGLGEEELKRAVSSALVRGAARDRKTLSHDKQGFSAYRFAKKVAAIRAVGQQVVDLEFQGKERLRELYVRLVLGIGKAA